ncbi:DUF4249 domain-containing protein [Chitinophaga sp. S165]|uniref:DUF4249 domain-containing protein n=1 Tax=Chitinophaga sp. S165 TaxID=2135462 RepID=UPI000D71A84F|nr:DUF4249 domain-containing protein [Chitinophaga sp. S165]PWV46536.1 uncharacterized protein DUF4249 [Chitinophaga sp. S165]
MQIRSLLFFLLILTISSCEKYIDIAIPEESNKPVLNLLMNKDSVMIARVTFSGRLHNFEPMQEAKNATVDLYENGTFKETLTPFVNQGFTYYRANTLPRAGASYRVTAAIPGFAEVSGTDKIPDTVKIGETKLVVAQVNGWQTQATVTVQLHDDPDVQNYYRIRLYQIYEWKDSYGNIELHKQLQYFETDEAELPLFNDEMRSDLYITDALFNGRSPRFVLRSNVYGDKLKMAVEVTSLTYHSYNYLNSAYMAWEKNEDPLSEKVIVYNNIVNGLGIVGGVAQRYYELAEQ